MGVPIYGAKLGLRDNYNGPKGFRSLKSFDPDRPPPDGLEALSPTTGIIAPKGADNSALGINPKRYLLVEFMAEGKDDLSLEDYLRTCRRVELRATPSTSPRHCYEIAAEEAQWSQTISVDPRANFMVRRLERRPNSSNKSVAGFAISEVVEFQDTGGGVFLPTKIVDRIKFPNGIRVTRLDSKVLSVNQPLPDDAFEIKFSDGLFVIDSLAGKFHVWGPDDKPRMTFETAADYQKWAMPGFIAAELEFKRRQAEATGGFGRRAVVLGSVTACAVLTVGALLFWLRARRARTCYST
jgi:hypothetical protein